jgi:hypothetical protein
VYNGDLPLADVTLYLDQNNNGVLDNGEFTATTDPSGAYAFEGLAAGTYTVAQVVPAGMAQTSPAPTPGPGALGDVLQDIPAPTKTPYGLAYVGGYLYVSSDSGPVYRIDPATGNVISQLTVTPASRVIGLAFDGTDFWATSLGKILRFDTAGNLLQSFPSPAGHALGIAWDSASGSLWVSDNGRIYNMNTDGTRVSSFAAPDGEAFGLAFDGAHLWAANWQGTQKLYELDRTGAVLRSVAAPRTIESSNGTWLGGLGYDGQALWVGRYEAGQPGSFPAVLLRVDTSGPGSQQVILAADQTVSGVNFGDFQLGSITGRVYSDNNHNGHDDGEPGLAGWRVYLDGNANHLLDLWEPSAVTGDNGGYSFTGLRPGTYNVLVGSRGPGWAQTTPDGAGQTAEITSSGQRVDGANFGTYQLGLAPVGAELPVGATTTGQQGQPRAVATDSQGNFVVVWTSSDGISARLYNAAGQPRGNAFRVNVGTANAQSAPVVAMNDSGSFAVAWQTDSPSLGTYSVVARLFRSDGTPLTGDLAVTTATNKQRFTPTDIGMDAAGNVVVLYQGGKKSGPFWNDGFTLFQRYSASGKLLGSGTQVTDASLVNGGSSLAMASDGRFAVAWNDGPVYVQRYNASGKKVGAQITTAFVNVYANVPSIAMNATGSFVVALAGSAQIFNADGTPRTAAPFSISTRRGAWTAGAFTQSDGMYGGYRPGVSMDSSGNVVFAWSDSANIKARRFDSNGIALDYDLFLVSAAVGGPRYIPSVSMTGGGNFVVAWIGPGAGSGYGVFAQRSATPSGSRPAAALPPGGDGVSARRYAAPGRRAAGPSSALVVDSVFARPAVPVDWDEVAVSPLLARKHHGQPGE